jgi:hypothetical protein
MPRSLRFLILILTLSLLASCGPQTADRRPQADGGQLTVDGGQPTLPSPTFTLSPSPTPTETAIPRPSLESSGLFAETQALLKRQGWDIAWDAQNTRYRIRQRAFDEASQTFTSQLTHEAGWIDLEGNLHFTATYFSAQENEDGTWKDTSTQSEVVVDLKNFPQNPDLTIRQTDENGNSISFQEKLKTPGFHLLETKNPAFEKTGILTLTYLDENGIPQTVTYNRELNFLQMPEISTDLLHPTTIPIEAVHSLAAHKLLILNYGDGEPFPTENFPGWSIQFQYFPDNGTKRAYLWPRDGTLTPKYIRFIGEKDFKIPWFMILLPDGTAYPSAPVEIFNPKEPQNPKDGNEKLILFPALFTGTMTPSQRIEFLKSFPYDNDLIRLFGRQRIITLAAEPNSDGDGYFTVLYKTNDGGWNKVGDRRPLDSLLGMENIMGENGISYFPAIYNNVIYGNGPSEPPLSEELPLIEWDLKGTPLPKELQGKIFVISP